MFFPPNSVNYQLSPTFHSNAISLRAIILQTFGFHQSIAHSFVTLETKFHVNDVITASVTCKKLAHVIYQLSATVIYYRPSVHFPIAIYYRPVPKLCSITLVGFNGSLRYFCRILRISCQVAKSCGFGFIVCFHRHVIAIRVFIF